MKDEDLEYFKGLMKAKVAPRNLSKIIVNRTGKDYTYKDVVNLISRIKQEEESCPVEKFLATVRDEGGSVFL